MGFFRDPVDADVKRKEITWIAILCLFMLAAWQFLATFLGGATDFSPRSYEEKVLFGGLGAILLCSVLYIATQEREQRLLNQRLLSDLREAMSRLNDRVQQLHSLCSTSTEFVGALEPEVICRLTVEALVKQLKAEEYSLTFLHSRRGWMEFKVNGSELIVQEGERAVLRADFHASGPRISAPLQVEDTTVGTLSASRDPGQPDFSPEEMSLLITSANMTANALENARLHEELKESYLSTLRTLIQLLGARDNYTASHAQRVSNLVCRFAERLHLPEEQIQLLEEFAPLHDLGKVGIPDHILLKMGELTVAEKKACEQHPAIGEQILRPLRPDSRALEMVRNHHERWDGSGYPDGLAGEKIPLLARILHIADSYDAILSEKPYSAGMAPHEALAEIRLDAGRQFDPVLAEAFAAMLEEEGVTLPEGLALAVNYQSKHHSKWE
jgi:HD-GYP domain-containing protein (c-di-GMP phosphodiesterase class II)